LLDLAALIGGKWSDAERSRIIAAYAEAIEAPAQTGNFLLGLACCRLVLALRWLGWSPAWTPPTEHAQDWLEAAVGAAAEVGIS
jgi:hypothetical protein